MKPCIQFIPRSTDEIWLEALRRARAGEKMGPIARDLGRNETFARVIVARTRAADLAESGEPASLVAAAYPPKPVKAERSE